MQITSSEVNYSTYSTDDMDINNDQGELSQTDFLNLFITQLQNQDPTDPMDNSAMMEQTATFTQVELLTSIENHLEELASGADESSLAAQMASSSAFIGKLVEYEGNNTYLSDGAAAITFQAEEVPFKTTVTIRDSSGEFVRSFSPDVNDTDMNTFYWNGTDADGNAVEEGKYTFTVTMVGTDGEKIDAQTYGNGLVTGVKTVDGKLVYEVDGSDIDADLITSVRDASLGGA